MIANAVGKPLPRVDGREKVTGRARYTADMNQAGQVYAVIVGATAGLGRIIGIDVAPVARMPGVIAVISHLNAPTLAYQRHKGPIDPGAGERLHVLQDDRVQFYGQPVAIVVAGTLDQAERGAAALRITYATRKPVISIDQPEAVAVAPEARSRVKADSLRGDVDSVLDAAAFKVDAAYAVARENHNPMEPHATIAAWNGDRVTVWSKSQFVANEQAELAAVFGIPRENVRVICPYIGGAFGTSLRTWPHVTLAAVAARHVGRPVKLALTRKQMFVATGHRPATEQRMVIGANTDGKLAFIDHQGTGETSRYEQFVEALTATTTFMYSCPNVRTSYRLKPLDTATPTYMRGPGEATGMYALECTIDELSYQLGINPVELRRRNEPQIDEGEEKPFSSRSLVACYAKGVEAFGWHRRDPRPRSMTSGRLLTGMGVASATYPALFSPCSALVRLLENGTAEVEVAASDMGPGTYTSMTQVSADMLGLLPRQVTFKLGDSNFPAAPPHGGSQTMASVGSAIRAACTAVQAESVKRAVSDRRSPFFGRPVESLEWRGGKLYSSDSGSLGVSYGEIVASVGSPIVGRASAQRDPEAASKFSMHAFGAVFVEVGVDPDVGMISVRRALGVYGAGRIVNPRLATSQCVGGMIGGIGMALMERTVLDLRDGRPVNAHMADYLMPVNRDTPQIDVQFVDEEDFHVSPIGVKGLGEIALVGMAPAIANAVFHATGIRVRNLPIRLEDVLTK